MHVHASFVQVVKSQGQFQEINIDDKKELQH